MFKETYGQYPSEFPVDYCKEPMPVTNAHAWKKLVAATTMCLIFMVNFIIEKILYLLFADFIN